MYLPDEDKTRAGSATGTQAEAADVAVAERLGRYRDNPVVKTIGAMSEVADQVPLFVLSGAVAAAGLVAGKPTMAKAGAHMLGSALVATAIKSAIKRLVARTRPKVLIEDGIYAVEPVGPDSGNWHSFPSGHTADAVSAARALVRVVPQAAIPAYAAAAVIAVVQVPRAKHYPADILAGAVVGVVAEAIVHKAAASAAEWLTRLDEADQPGRDQVPAERGAPSHMDGALLDGERRLLDGLGQGRVGVAGAGDVLG